jgi:hypothetical protein
VLIAAYTGKRSAVIRALQWHPNTEGDGWVDLDTAMIHWGHSGTNKRRGDPTPVPRPLMNLLRLRSRRRGAEVRPADPRQPKPAERHVQEIVAIGPETVGRAIWPDA